MLGLRSFVGPRLPAARKSLSRTGRACFGMAVRVACLPYTGPVACARRVNQTAVSVAELGLDLACGFVPELLSVEEGDVLEDLSQADLEEAYLQAGISFSASTWSLVELQHQAWLADEPERQLAAAQQSYAQLQQQLLEQQQQLLEQQQCVEQAAAAHTAEQQRLETEVRRLHEDKARLQTQAQQVPDLVEQLQAASLATAEASQAHEEQVCQLHSELTLQSDLLHTSKKEFAELRRQLSTLRAALTEEEVSHSQARMDLESKQLEVNSVQQDLASLKQCALALEAEASSRSEELTSTRLMFQEATATAQQPQQEAQDENKRLQCEVDEQRARAAELQQALGMQQEALKAAVQEGEQVVAQERTQVGQLEKSLVDANHSHGSTNLKVKSQQDASGQVPKRTGSKFLFDRGISGSSNSGSGIPANYGPAPSDPTHESPLPARVPTVSNGMAFTDTQTFLNPGDGAVPATRTSGDPIGMVEEALNPTTQTLGDILSAYTSVHVHEDGIVPFAQPPGSTPVPPHATQSPQDIPDATQSPQDSPDAEEAPACEHDSGNKLTVIIQQLLNTVEAAVNPAQGPPLHLKSSGGTINCVLPSDTRAQLAGLIIDAFLVSVDVFQKEGKFPAAITLMAKVVDVAHWASLPAGKQSELHGRRALVSRAANQPVHAFADWLHAAELRPSSSAAVEVVNQLGHWGNFAAMCLFFQCIQGCLRDSGVACFDALEARMHFWVSSGGCIARVLNMAPRPQLPGQVLPDPPIPDEITPLVRRFPQNQALMCLQARQRMQLGKFQEAMQTVAPFLGGTHGVAPSRWALHLTVQVHWLSGELNEMVGALKQLLQTDRSPLEANVYLEYASYAEYRVPENSLLEPLLTRLEAFQALWETNRRLFTEDLSASEAALQQVDSTSAGLLSPALRSRQLLRWAGIHFRRTQLAVSNGQPETEHVVKTLTYCERARALNPLCWSRAVKMQEHLLRMLGSGGALYELYSAVLDEPGLTEEEQVEYTALKSAADPLPSFCKKWDAGNKPPLNPAQLLGVDFTSNREEVNAARAKLVCFCHPDKACLPKNSFVTALEGVGALMGPHALQAMDRLKSARDTISLVNLAAETLTNRFKRAHAEAWLFFKYTADDLAGNAVPPSFAGMVMHRSFHSSSDFVTYVRDRRKWLAGEHEFQDVAPDPQSSDESSEEETEEDAEEESEEGPEEESEEESEEAYIGKDEHDVLEYQSD